MPPQKETPRSRCSGLQLLPQPEALSILTVGDRGTPLGSGPLEEITFKPALRFIAGERGTRVSPIQHHHDKFHSRSNFTWWEKSDDDEIDCHCGNFFSLAIGAGAALAQNPPPAPAGTTDKQAISKACSDQANAKGLHGKARKKFRAKCKHHGGKM
jgi:psiF repeat